MSALYVESSAVLAWLNGQPEADSIIRLMDEADAVLTSALTPVEVKRGLHRREKSGELTGASRNQLLGLLENRLAGWEIVEITPAVQARAGETFPVEPVRTLDAIHLATVLEFLKVFPDLQVLSLDRRVLSNAEPLGLVTALP